MTDIHKFIQFLQIHHPFNQMPIDMLEKFTLSMQVHHYGAGQTIFHKGEEAMIFYIVNTGTVREIFKGNHGEETTISLLKSGDSFGAISILTGQRRLVDAVVEEDVELYVIYKEDLFRLLHEYPAINIYLNRTFSQKLSSVFEYFNREKIKFIDKEKSAHEKEKELALINEITKLMSSEADIEHKLFQVVDLLKKHMSADACSIFILDNLSDRMILEAASGLELPKDKAIEMNASEGVTGWVVKNREPASIENVDMEPRIKFISEIHEERFKSLLSVPLISGEETFGAINFQTIKTRIYNFEEIRGMTIAGGQIAMTLHNALLKKRLEADIETLQTEKGAVPAEFVGNSPSIKRINRFIAKTADSDKPILLEGEEGTGKELLARLIHSSSQRNKGPFVEVDCGFFPSESWGDELFGAEKDRYSASIITNRGFIEKADKGILFLKNIEKLNGACQIKIRNFIQSGLYNRVGSKTQHRVNVRLISTSNVDLKTRVLSGSYDKNTYESLKFFEFKTESLRKTKRDIPELCSYLLKRIGRQIHNEGLSLSESAEKKIQSYDWPGNVAELENVLKGAAIVAPGNIIEPNRLFFPSRSPKDKPVFNLFGYSRLSELLKKKLFPNTISKIILLIFGLSIFALIAFPQNNLLNSTFWSLGWLSIFLITFFVGRVFCAICPFMVAGEALRKLKCLDMSRPAIISRYGQNITVFLIFVILWIEGAFDFPHKPVYTASLLLSITLGAVVCSILFKRRVWCRYLCPMGNFLGIYSLTSFFSVNADRHVCQYRCGTHDCYTGKGDDPGCQLFLHPYGIESQQHCVLCMQCHKNCPYGSVKLNLQFPGTGILAVSEPSILIALASTALLGVLPVESGSLFAPGNFLFNNILESSGLNSHFLYALLFLTAALLPALLFLIMEKLLGGYNFKKSIARLTRVGYSLLPLAILGHIAFYGKKSAVWVENVFLQTGMKQIDFYSANILFYGICAIVVLFGFFGAIHTFIRLRRSNPADLATSRSLMYGYSLFICFYTIIYLLALL